MNVRNDQRAIDLSRVLFALLSVTGAPILDDVEKRCDYGAASSPVNMTCEAQFLLFYQITIAERHQFNVLFLYFGVDRMEPCQLHQGVPVLVLVPVPAAR